MKELTKTLTLTLKKKKKEQKHVPGQPGSSRGLETINKKTHSSKQNLCIVPIFSEGKRPDPGSAAWLPCLRSPAEAGNGQYSEMETQLVVVNTVFWSEGLSN